VRDVEAPPGGIIIVWAAEGTVAAGRGLIPCATVGKPAISARMAVVHLSHPAALLAFRTRGTGGTELISLAGGALAAERSACGLRCGGFDGF